MSCTHELGTSELVPVFSYLFLRGRCKHCGSRISIQYPLVELSTAFIFGILGGSLLPAFSYLLVADTVSFAETAVFIVSSFAVAALFIAIAAYDIRHTIIPDSWAYSLAVFALVSQVCNALLSYSPIPWSYLLLAGPAAALPFAALWLVSGGKWMGLGDAKLALGIGWLLGPVDVWAAIMLAFIIGALFSVCILLPLPRLVRFGARLGITPLEHLQSRFTMRSEVAFGPFLVCGSLIIWFMQLNGYDPVSLWLAFFTFA